METRIWQSGIKNWDSKKSNFKARFPFLTDEDLHCEQNQTEGMFEKLENKLGMSPDELQITILSL
jgi:hypothetical protein